jgi:hypothetical protein
MRELIEDLKAALPAVFESEDYRARRSAIDDEFERRQGEGLSELKRKANKQNIVIIRTPLGIGLAPSREGKIACGGGGGGLTHRNTAIIVKAS